jgi:hypothetical protein
MGRNEANTCKYAGICPLYASKGGEPAEMPVFLQAFPLSYENCGKKNVFLQFVS